MKPEKFEHPVVAESVFDVQNPGVIRVALDWQIQSLILDFMADGQGGAPSGSVSVYVGQNIAGLPWATLAAGKMMSRPIAVSGSGTVLTIVPAANSKGLLHVTGSKIVVAPGRW